MAAGGDGGRLSPRTSVVVLVLGANFVGAVISNFLPVSARESNLGDVVFYGIAFAVYIAVSFIVGGWFVSVFARRGLGWVIEDRAPGPDDRAAILALPLRCAAVSAVAWLGSGIVFGALRATRDAADADLLVALVLRNLLIGLTAGAIAFLFVERRIRRYYGPVLAASPHEKQTVGIHGRFVLSWVLGSAVPLLIFAGAFAGRNAVERARLAEFAWLFAGVAVLSGSLTVVAAAHSVVGPLERLRRALGKVEQGDLDAAMVVDDATEIGLLQAGFNQMVTGLRERQRLRDLFGRHVGEEVARQALESEATLGGQVVPASALFVDLIGSTSFAEDRDPKEVVAVLNEFFATVVSAVTAEGGWVNKFEGDAALCVFGPPVGHADHARRALQAALALRRGLDDFKLRHPALDAGIGVASGSVVAGNVGAEDRYEFTVIGDPVNQAARLTEIAKGVPSRLVASESTVLAGARGDWLPYDEVRLRGRSATTMTYVPA